MFHGARGKVDLKGVKELKCPEEGGTKQLYDDFLRSVKSQIGVGWSDGYLIGRLIEEREDGGVQLPADVKVEASEAEKVIWLEQVKLSVGSIKNYKDKKQAFYSLLHSHLSKATRTKVEGSDGFDAADEEKDPVWLLITLDDIMLGYEKITPTILSMDDQLCRIANLR